MFLLWSAACGGVGRLGYYLGAYSVFGVGVLRASAFFLIDL